MYKTTVKLIICLLIVFNGNALFGQKDTITSTHTGTSNTCIKGKFSVGGGIGFATSFGSTYFSTLPLNSPDPDGYYNYYPKPAFSGFLEYGISNKLSIGLAVTYESMLIIYDGSGSAADANNIITRTNAGIRLLYHFYTNNYVDEYIATRQGISYWTDALTENPNGLLPLAIGSPVLIRYSFQFLYGITVYPDGKHLGLNAEVAIGAPYLVNAGIVFKI